LHNLRSHLDNFVFAFIADPYDRRLLRQYISSLIVPAVTDDKFSAAQGTAEADKWIIPGDIPMSNCLQSIQQLPVFPTTGILQMTPGSASIRNWNLSRWILRPFILYLRERNDLDVGNALGRLDNVVMLLPERIRAPDLLATDGLCSVYLITEIEKMNATLRFISQQLAQSAAELRHCIVTDDTKSFVQGEVPMSWKLQSGYFCTDSTAKFTSHLIQRHSLFLDWLRQGKPKVIDAGIPDDRRSFMLAFLCDEGSLQRIPVDQLTYDFALSTSVDVDVPGSSFALRGITLMCGAIQDNLLTTPGEKVSSYQPIPMILCKVMKKADRKGTFFGCPLYRQAFIAELNEREAELDLCEGQSPNFVWECPLATDRAEKDFVDFGTAMFCRVPDQFAS
jgi:hypothetical protein